MAEALTPSDADDETAVVPSGDGRPERSDGNGDGRVPGAEMVPATRGGELGRPLPPLNRRHRRRFTALFFVLGSVAVLAGALAVGLATGRGHHAAPTWSTWKPTRDGGAGAQQVADHVGPQYRLPNGQQLVSVQGGELSFQNIPTRIVLNAGAGGANKIQLVQGDSVLYTLCGLGDRCSIRSGKPSVTRHVLLQREALELALYSFRYLNVDNAVVLMPPPPGEKRSEAMLFRQKDLEPLLDRPLRRTLPVTTVSVNDFPATGEVRGIQRLAGPRDFRFSLIQGQDATLLLVLDPFAQ